MSLLRGCLLVEREPNRWFCLVATNEYDFEFSRGSTVYGPCATEDAAYERMSDRECNPGQSSTITHERVTPELLKLLDGARKAAPRGCFDGWSHE